MCSNAAQHVTKSLLSDFWIVLYGQSVRDLFFLSFFTYVFVWNTKNPYTPCDPNLVQIFTQTSASDGILQILHIVPVSAGSPSHIHSPFCFPL